MTSPPGGRWRARPAWVNAVIAGVCTAIAALIVFGLAYRLWRADLGSPFLYKGDAEANLMFAKGIIDHGWMQENPSLGAPNGQLMYDYPLGGDNLNYGLMWLIARFTDNPAVVVNVFFILTFVLVAITAFFVQRALGVNGVLAAGLSTLYAITPFHLVRGEAHLLLGAYFALPLAVYVGVRAFQGYSPIRRGMGWRGWVPLVLLCVVLGSTGVYMLVFGALVIGVLGGIGALRHRRGRLALGVAAVIALALGVGIANQGQSLLYEHRHGPNPVVAQRVPFESEQYGLKITGLILPTLGHPIDALRDARAQYAYNPTKQVTAGASTEPLGSIAAAGFLLLLIVVPVLAVAGVPARARAWVTEEMSALSVATMGCLLVATVGGFSSLFALLITPQIRGWDRIVLMLAFLALTAVGLVGTAGLRRLGARLRPRVALGATIALTLLVVGVGVGDQGTGAYVPKYAASDAEYRADREFVRQAVRRLGERAVVLQLPVVGFPESAAPSEKSGPYSGVRPYLHAPPSMRWSYGAMMGRPADVVPAIAALPPPEMVRAAAAAGFTAIWIDRFASPSGTTPLERRLESLLGPAVLERADGRYVVYTLERAT